MWLRVLEELELGLLQLLREDLPALALGVLAAPCRAARPRHASGCTSFGSREGAWLACGADAQRLASRAACAGRRSSQLESTTSSQLEGGAGVLLLSGNRDLAFFAIVFGCEAVATVDERAVTKEEEYLNLTALSYRDLCTESCAASASRIKE